LKDVHNLELDKEKNWNITFEDNIPLNIQYVALQAYRRYPELQWVNIKFKWVNGFWLPMPKQHVMRSQVEIWSIIKELMGLAKKAERQYVIRVNLLDKEWVITLPKLDQNSKWWVMSHELYHTLHYSTMSARDYARFGLWFATSPRWVKGMEKGTDYWSIARWTGYWLATFRQQVFAWSEKSYLDYKKRTYLSPKEILWMVLANYEMYHTATLERSLEILLLMGLEEWSSNNFLWKEIIS
jgi:hypothetical protein